MFVDLYSIYFHSGSRSGTIHHHDVRVPNHHVGTLQGHTQEVCGLKWSQDGKFLASGGNDNLLNIWGVQPGSFVSETQPLYTFSQHQAAVKVRHVEKDHCAIYSKGKFEKIMQLTAYALLLELGCFVITAV